MSSSEITKVNNAEEIKKTLEMFTASAGFKMFPPLLESWEVSLSGVPNKWIIKAREHILKSGVPSGNKIPQPWEFRDICREMKREGTIKEDQDPVNYNSIPDFKQKASEISRKLDLKNKKRISANERPKLILYEYLNMKGETIELRCQGHINRAFFAEQCLIFSRKPISEAKYKYRVFRKFPTKDNNGKVVSHYLTYADCDERTMGAEPVTIGYFQ